MKWITFKPQNANDAQSITTQWMVDEFKKRTGGKHEFQVFWGGSVAKAKEIPDALSGGAGDIGDIITPYFPDKFPLNNAVGFFIPQPRSTICRKTWRCGRSSASALLAAARWAAVSQ